MQSVNLKKPPFVDYGITLIFITQYFKFNYNSIFLFRFEKEKSDKHILDYLLDSKRYDKRLLPPSYGNLY